MLYKIQAVSQTVREYDSKYGPMKSYKVKFVGNDEAIELTQKASSPAPYEGQELEGEIDTSGQYGPKFKKAYGSGGGSYGGGGKSYGSKPMADPFTMYLSYAKDIVVAAMARGDKLSVDDAISATLDGGKKLYDARPDAPAQVPEAVKEVFGSKDVVIDEISDDPIDLSEIPF